MTTSASGTLWLVEVAEVWYCGFNGRGSICMMNDVGLLVCGLARCCSVYMCSFTSAGWWNEHAVKSAAVNRAIKLAVTRAWPERMEHWIPQPASSSSEASFGSRGSQWWEVLYGAPAAQPAKGTVVAAVVFGKETPADSAAEHTSPDGHLLFHNGNLKANSFGQMMLCLKWCYIFQ